MRVYIDLVRVWWTGSMSCCRRQIPGGSAVHSPSAIALFINDVAPILTVSFYLPTPFLYWHGFCSPSLPATPESSRLPPSSNPHEDYTLRGRDMTHERSQGLEFHFKGSRSFRRSSLDGFIPGLHLTSRFQARRCPTDAGPLEDRRTHEVSEAQVRAAVRRSWEEDHGGILGEIIPWISLLPTGEG